MIESPPKTSQNRIYLIGMMGSGKSTIARMLAKQLDWTWIDTDACVERNANLTVADIFAQSGEDAFRKREWECVQQAAGHKNVVVSCGGGAPCYYDAINVLLTTGVVIYLRASTDSLVSRLEKTDQSRPLLFQTDLPLREQIDRLLAQREEVYKRAHIIIDTDAKTEEDLLRELLSLVGSISDMTLQR